MANEAKPTLHDVADEARVSIATVSRVVNGAANVRTQTRMRVEQAVSRLGYIPNPQARELRKCSTARAWGPSMISAAISAAAGGQPEGSYVQARSITGFTQLLFVSGQVPVGRDGIAPDSFEQQAEVAWANVLAQLETAAMTPINLVKVTTYLARRTDKTPNREVRERILGDHLPALTVVIAEIFDADWLIEIEAIAAK